MYSRPCVRSSCFWYLFGTLAEEGVDALDSTARLQNYGWALTWWAAGGVPMSTVRV
jgi:hypothetical protein